MPAITLHPRAIHSLSSRQSNTFNNDGQNGKRILSTTAIGFLVPLFVAFIIGPFLAVYFIRRRRERRIDAILAAMPRENKRKSAKTKLEGVTKVVSRVSAMDEKDAERAGKEGEGDSISERECAICLSTLYAPSPPEPLKLKDEPTNTTTTTESPTTNTTTRTTAPSLSDQEEEILRLHICNHEFHAECLTSWVLMRRYTCPICRAVFWKKASGKESKEAGHVRESMERTEGEAHGTGDQEMAEGSQRQENHSTV